MRAKYLILAIALLCLLALPSTALAADDSSANAKIDDSVTSVQQATGGDQAVPVIVYTDQDAVPQVEQILPDGVSTTDLDQLNAFAAYLTPERSTPWRTIRRSA